jgi:2-dehydro-3-deoxyphosphooctonate aldolase (KDO 8-P synthase)
MTTEIRVGEIRIGNGAPLALLAGPCAIESREICLEVARQVKAMAIELGIPYIFKASFDKANRTSISSYRGIGMEEGLAVLAEVKETFDLPVVTDIHEPWQAEKVAEVADILQIPAFLCRQTDLVVAAARTGKPVNIKKAQFLSPWDMKNVVQKAKDSGNDQIFLTERGTSFGYNNLVVDMRGLAVMREMGVPVVFDATHSLQLPGGMGNASGGMTEYVPHLVRAACAVGIDALFMEVHPNPCQALCDATTMIQVGDDLFKILSQAVAYTNLSRQFEF